MSTDITPIREILFDNIEDLKEALNQLSLESVEPGFGHEGCILKILEQKDLWDYLVPGSPVKKLLLPYIPQSRWSAFTQWIDRLLESGWQGRVVLNDWGSLRYVSQNNNGNITMGAGRLFGYSFAEIPYREEYYRHQLESDPGNEHLKDFVTNMDIVGVCHKDLIDELKSQGVEFMEISDSDSQQFPGSVKLLKQWGMDVYIYKNWRLGSLSRICQSAKFRNQCVPECVQGCNKVYQLKMNSVIHKQHLTVIPEVPAFFPDIFVNGNLFHNYVVDTPDVSSKGIIETHSLKRGMQHV